MEIFINAFNLFLCQPLFNALVFLYKYLPGHDFGVAIIVLTVVIRLLLYPLMTQSIKSQKILNNLQPKIQEIQNKHKSDKNKQGQAMMELYKNEKINPFGGCLPLLIQLPILFALYRVFWKGLQPEQLNQLYSFVSFSGQINPDFLGIINLGEASVFLAVLAGITQFIQTKMTMPKIQKAQGGKDQMSQFSNMMQKQMLYLLPIFTVFILWKMPSAIAVYWIVTALFTIAQQYLIFKKINMTGSENLAAAGQQK
jgi:YidC/Oxa1 family membrane protein insertase